MAITPDELRRAFNSVGESSNRILTASDTGTIRDLSMYEHEIEQAEARAYEALQGSELRTLSKPKPGEVLVLQGDLTYQQRDAFVHALHKVWPGVPVLVLPPDHQLSVGLVAPIIDNLQKLAARNDLKRYDP